MAAVDDGDEGGRVGGGGAAQPEYDCEGDVVMERRARVDPVKELEALLKELEGDKMLHVMSNPRVAVTTMNDIVRFAFGACDDATWSQAVLENLGTAWANGWGDVTLDKVRRRIKMLDSAICCLSLVVVALDGVPRRAPRKKAKRDSGGGGRPGKPRLVRMSLAGAHPLPDAGPLDADEEDGPVNAAEMLAGMGVDAADVMSARACLRNLYVQQERVLGFARAVTVLRGKAGAPSLASSVTGSVAPNAMLLGFMSRAVGGCTKFETGRCVLAEMARVVWLDTVLIRGGEAFVLTRTPGGDSTMTYRRVGTLRAFLAGVQKSSTLASILIPGSEIGRLADYADETGAIFDDLAVTREWLAADDGFFHVPSCVFVPHSAASVPMLGVDEARTTDPAKPRAFNAVLVYCAGRRFGDVFDRMRGGVNRLAGFQARAVGAVTRVRCDRPEDLDMRDTLDRIFLLQDFTPEDKLMVMAMVFGRTLARQKKHDGWDVVMQLFGPTNTGKSTLMSVLMKLVPRELSEIIEGNNFDPKFHPANIGRALVVFLEEALAGTFPRALFNAIADCAELSTSVKFVQRQDKSVMDAGFLAAGNEALGSEGDVGGSTSRRAVIAFMLNSLVNLERAGAAAGGARIERPPDDELDDGAVEALALDDELGADYADVAAEVVAVRRRRQEDVIDTGLRDRCCEDALFIVVAGALAYARLRERLGGGRAFDLGPSPLETPAKPRRHVRTVWPAKWRGMQESLFSAANPIMSCLREAYEFRVWRTIQPDQYHEWMVPLTELRKAVREWAIRARKEPPNNSDFSHSALEALLSPYGVVLKTLGGGEAHDAKGAAITQETVVALGIRRIEGRVRALPKSGSKPETVAEALARVRDGTADANPTADDERRAAAFAEGLQSSQARGWVPHSQAGGDGGRASSGGDSYPF